MERMVQKVLMEKLVEEDKMVKIIKGKNMILKFLKGFNKIPQTIERFQNVEAY